MFESTISKGLFGIDFFASLTMKWQASQTGDSEWLTKEHSNKTAISINSPLLLILINFNNL